MLSLLVTTLQPARPGSPAVYAPVPFLLMCVPLPPLCHRPCERDLQLLWSFAALTILPVALSMLPVQYSLVKQFPIIPHSHVDVVSGAAAAVAFIGELFMIKAMLVYDDKRSPAKHESKVCAHSTAQHMLACSS
jgi:hypothetical protein